MSYNYNQKGIWRIVNSQFVDRNSKNWNDAVIEEQLKYSDFKEANELIAKIKEQK